MGYTSNKKNILDPSSLSQNNVEFFVAPLWKLEQRDIARRGYLHFVLLKVNSIGKT